MVFETENAWRFGEILHNPSVKLTQEDGDDCDTLREPAQSFLAAIR